MIDVDKTTFEEEVLKAEGYVFVDFYGDGCVPCQALMPKVHEFDCTAEAIEAMIKKYI